MGFFSGENFEMELGLATSDCIKYHGWGNIRLTLIPISDKKDELIGVSLGLNVDLETNEVELQTFVESRKDAIYIWLDKENAKFCCSC